MHFKNDVWREGRSGQHRPEQRFDFLSAFDYAGRVERLKQAAQLAMESAVECHLPTLIWSYRIEQESCSAIVSQVIWMIRLRQQKQK
jgi:hypothetical protein